MQTGDTLIEVLFAVTVFSLVAVGSLSIMNQGTATAQRSLEITLVRQEIDGQAEALRFIHDSYIAAYPNVVSGEVSGEWSKIIAKSIAQASAFGTCPATRPAGAFILNTKTAKLEPDTKLTFAVPTYSQLRYNASVLMSAEGLWVEAVAGPLGTSSRSIDFHIRACWQSSAQTTPMTLGTIVRLYEPRP
ncbi:hypothetical protein H7X69_01550 [Candidatus Saccharibacteria bacterium]|nr:hypothetical protein [Candidatus Saccharibacteria bacterium]